MSDFYYYTALVLLLIGFILLTLFIYFVVMDSTSGTGTGMSETVKPGGSPIDKKGKGGDLIFDEDKTTIGKDQSEMFV